MQPEITYVEKKQIVIVQAPPNPYQPAAVNGMMTQQDVNVPVRSDIVSPDIEESQPEKKKT